MTSQLQAPQSESPLQSSPTKPAWAGDDLLSKVVNTLINTKPIYALMKQQARQVLIKTAEKNGIPWRDRTQSLLNSGIQNQLKQFTNPNLTYPDYYEVPFHAYDAGNLCWEAACEAESATYSMALRVWKNEELTADEAQARLRSSFHHVLAERGITKVDRILDVGCSVGISTKTIHQYYQPNNPNLSTIGLDLSPYMLAVAAQQDTQGLISQWKHQKAESTEFDHATFDLISMQFVLHELPRSATREIFREMHRILKPGGHFAIVDNNPQSKVIQNLPPVLFTLMKSTEPWTDDYYTFDVESALNDAGFVNISTVESDPRHRTIVAQKLSPNLAQNELVSTHFRHHEK